MHADTHTADRLQYLDHHRVVGSNALLLSIKQIFARYWVNSITKWEKMFLTTAQNTAGHRYGGMLSDDRISSSVSGHQCVGVVVKWSKLRQLSVNH